MSPLMILARRISLTRRRYLSGKLEIGGFHVGLPSGYKALPHHQAVRPSEVRRSDR